MTFFFEWYGDHRDLHVLTHSFPTRRSSDLMTMTWSRGAQPGERVKSVSVNGKPLDPTATYTVATNDFIAAGGDGYAVLTETKPLIDGDAAKYMASMEIGRAHV